MLDECIFFSTEKGIPVRNGAGIAVKFKIELLVRIVDNFQPFSIVPK